MFESTTGHLQFNEYLAANTPQGQAIRVVKTVSNFQAKMAILRHAGRTIAGAAKTLHLDVNSQDLHELWTEEVQRAIRKAGLEHEGQDVMREFLAVSTWKQTRSAKKDTLAGIRSTLPSAQPIDAAPSATWDVAARSDSLAQSKRPRAIADIEVVSVSSGDLEFMTRSEPEQVDLVPVVRLMNEALGRLTKRVKRLERALIALQLGNSRLSTNKETLAAVGQSDGGSVSINATRNYGRARLMG